MAADPADPSRDIHTVDEREHDERVRRLELLNAEVPYRHQHGLVIHGGPPNVQTILDAEFAYVYGAARPALLAAWNFCRQQLAGMLGELGELDEISPTLERLAELAAEAELLDGDLKINLQVIHDRVAVVTHIGDDAHLAEILHAVELAIVTGQDLSEADEAAALHTVATSWRLVFQASGVDERTPPPSLESIPAVDEDLRAAILALLRDRPTGLTIGDIIDALKPPFRSIDILEELGRLKAIGTIYFPGFAQRVTDPVWLQGPDAPS